MLRIYADFNAQDASRRIRLNTNGSLADINRFQSELREGLLVKLYAEEGIAVSAHLAYEDGVWLAEPDWSTLIRPNDADESPCS